MPWRVMLQRYLTQKLLESEAFHQAVRTIHRSINGGPGFSQNLKTSAAENEKVSKALKFVQIVLDEIKQAVRGKLPK
ncbi:hypothetical protein V1506DRAFT_506647 [Lipomyces tetrasporus]